MHGTSLAARGVSDARGRPVDFPARVIVARKSTLTTQRGQPHRIRPAHPRNRHRRAPDRCGRARQNMRVVPRRQWGGKRRAGIAKFLSLNWECWKFVSLVIGVTVLAHRPLQRHPIGLQISKTPPPHNSHDMRRGLFCALGLFRPQSSASRFTADATTPATSRYSLRSAGPRRVWAAWPLSDGR